MTTLVFHSSTLGVTEYSTAARGLAGDFEATDDGLYSASGILDDAAPVVSSFSVPVMSNPPGLKQRPISGYVLADSVAALKCEVTTSAGTAYTYPLVSRTGRMARFNFGRGIRDNYLGFRVFNPDGKAFLIDHVEFVIEVSKQRKV